MTVDENPVSDEPVRGIPEIACDEHNFLDLLRRLEADQEGLDSTDGRSTQTNS